MTKEALEEQRSLVQAESDKLKSMTKEFQEECEHTWESVFRYDYPSGVATLLRARVLDHYVCSKCDLIKPKRRGLAWQVCQFCDGDMEYEGMIPGQGERHRVYECKTCGRSVTFT